MVRRSPQTHLRDRSGSVDVFGQVDANRYSALARVPVGQGAGSTSIHVKTRTQDGLFMSSPNTLVQGGLEILLYRSWPARSHSADEPGKPDLGSVPDPRRTADAGVRGGPSTVSKYMAKG